MFLGLPNFRRNNGEILSLDLNGVKEKGVSYFHVYRFWSRFFCFMGVVE